MAIDSLLISHKPTWWIMSSHSPSRQVHSGQPAEFYGLDALHQHPRCPNQSLGPDLNGELAFDGRTWDDPGLVLAIQSGSRIPNHSPLREGKFSIKDAWKAAYLQPEWAPVRSKAVGMSLHQSSQDTWCQVICKWLCLKMGELQLQLFW
jgi:hypothetical protein